VPEEVDCEAPGRAHGDCLWRCGRAACDGIWISLCLAGTRQNPRRRGLTKVGRCGVGGRVESKTPGENVGTTSELGNHSKACTSNHTSSLTAAMRIVPRQDKSCWLAPAPVSCAIPTPCTLAAKNTPAETAFSSRASRSSAFGRTAAMRRRKYEPQRLLFVVSVFFLDGKSSSDGFSRHKSLMLTQVVRRDESSLSILLSQIRDDAFFSADICR